MADGYWSREQARWVDAKAITLRASSQLSATANGATFFVGDRGTLRATLTATAKSGTNPTLDVKVQTSYDDVTWRDVAAFTQLTNTGTERKSFTGLDKYVRIVSTLGGSSTPTYTFSVVGDLV